VYWRKLVAAIDSSRLSSGEKSHRLMKMSIVSIIFLVCLDIRFGFSIIAVYGAYPFFLFLLGTRQATRKTNKTRAINNTSLTSFTS
jgi:hypothetical protein